MLITPEEARKKWCPMVRTVRVGISPYPDSYNRVVTTDVNTILLKDSEAESGTINANICATAIDMVPNSSRCIADACMMWREDAEFAPTHGYCGLVGKAGDPS